MDLNLKHKTYIEEWDDEEDEDDLLPEPLIILQ